MSQQTKAAAKPWESVKAAGGGEGSASDPLAAAFVESLSYDTRLYAADIRGSLAHAAMLEAVGLISPEDRAAIDRGLEEIRREIEAGPSIDRWPGWRVELEDVHMCIEAALIERVGEPGRRLHTGRSRNDQVALDLRLWMRDAAADLDAALRELEGALVGLAQRQGDVLIPSYTHLQRAQPACVGAECMAWHAMARRDRAALSRLVTDQGGLAASPLGSGAVAGSLLPLDRAMTAAAMGFEGPTQSSIDATASRDEALDFAYLLTRCALHLSRLAEQWIIYCTTEFGMVSLGEAYTTGSSMMPQKRNPDMLELVRGKAGGVLGQFVALATVVKGLPLGYNRDLQEDKRHLFTAFDQTLACVRMAARVVASAVFRSPVNSPLDRGYLDATALAEQLVTAEGGGVPFRTAHQIIGELVRLCESTGRHALAQLTEEEAAGVLAARGVRDARRVARGALRELGAERVAAAYRSEGHAGTGPGGYRNWLARCQAESAAGSAVNPLGSTAGASPERERGWLPGFDAEVDGGSTRGGEHTGGEDGLAEVLIGAYARSGRTLDDLPYTPAFEEIVAAARGARPGVTARVVLHTLHTLRKAGRLPSGAGGGAPGAAPPRLSIEEEGVLRDMVISAAGTLGQRDRLPYDSKFDALVAAFNGRVGRNLSPHAVWRLVAKLAK